MTRPPPIPEGYGTVDTTAMVAGVLGGVRTRVDFRHVWNSCAYLQRSFSVRSAPAARVMVSRTQFVGDAVAACSGNALTRSHPKPAAARTLRAIGQPAGRHTSVEGDACVATSTRAWPRTVMPAWAASRPPAAAGAPTMPVPGRDEIEPSRTWLRRPEKGSVPRGSVPHPQRDLPAAAKRPGDR
jgi:hypothetical protein